MALINFNLQNLDSSHFANAREVLLLTWVMHNIIVTYLLGNTKVTVFAEIKTTRATVEPTEDDEEHLMNSHQKLGMCILTSIIKTLLNTIKPPNISPNIKIKRI